MPTIEPIYKNVYVKSNQAGDFIVVNNYLVDELKKRNLWSEKMLEQIKFHDGSIQEVPEIPADVKDKYKEVFEIEPVWLLRSAAVRGKWIDQSQSLNIYYRGTSGKDISDIYMAAWRLGLKTTYYMRTQAASQVEKSTLNTSEYGATHTRKEFAQSSPAQEQKKEQGEDPRLQKKPVVLPQIPQSVEAVLTGAFNLLPTDPMLAIGPAMAPGASPNVRVNLQPRQPVSPQPMPVRRIISSGKNINICKIADPDCESCSA